MKEHEFYIDLGYADRVAELCCTPEEKAAVLLHWAQAEHASR